MRKNLHISCIAMLCIIVSCIEVYAIKATTNIVKYRQPDGSIILLKMYGDEFFGYSKSLDGFIVSPGPDRFLYYSNYNSGTLSITNMRVNSCNTANTENKNFRTSSIPLHTITRLREEAYITLNHTSSHARSTENRAQICHFSNAMEQPEDAVAKQHVPVLLVQFQDKEFTIEGGVKEYFGSMLNQKGYTSNAATGSAADYLNAAFAGKSSFIFDLYGVYTLPQSVEFYGKKGFSVNDENVAVMVQDACNAAYADGVDFSGYDSNGDGIVDNVAIIFAGCNEAESANSSLIWPHKGDISGVNLSLNGVKIGSYTCSSEYSGSEVEPVNATIGIFCHEYLHSFGLPDLYDVNGVVEGLSKALYGRLSIMDEGYYSNEGRTPPHLTSIEREILGLVPVKEIEAGKTYHLNSVQQSDTLYKIPVTSNAGEYFLLECRNSEGWDRYIGGKGLIVYHIDKSQAFCGGLSALQRWELNAVNSFATHECARVLASDPFMAENGELGGLFYPGLSSVNSLTASSVPKLTDWQQLGVGIELNNIAYKDGKLSFDATQGVCFNDSFPYATSITCESFQNAALLRWELPKGAAVGDSEAPLEEAFWYISLQQQDTLLPLIELKTKELYAFFNNLPPETAYKGSIFHATADSMGKVIPFEIKTDNITSQYPYLKLSGRYKRGSIICLNVQNLTEKHESVVAKLNGKVVHDGFILLNEPGEYKVEVTVFYPDRSHDIIEKKIVVE